MATEQNEDDAQDGDAGGVEQSTLYDALSDRRRRYALHYLKQCGEPVSVRDLAERVAAWENDKEPAELTSQERKRVYIALYQSHLSTLDDSGLVEYDEGAGTVALSEAMRAVDLYLEVVPRESIPWSLYYAGLTLANGVLLALAWYDVRPFGMLPDIAWGAVVLVAFGVSAFAQLYTSRQMRIGDAGPPPELQSPES